VGYQAGKPIKRVVYCLNIFQLFEAPLQFKVHAHVQRTGKRQISELTHDALGRNRCKGGHEEFTELLLKSFYQHSRYDLTILHILYIYYTLIL